MQGMNRRRQASDGRKTMRTVIHRSSVIERVELTLYRTAIPDVGSPLEAGSIRGA